MSDCDKDPFSLDALAEELMLATCQLQRRLRTASSPDELSLPHAVALARLNENEATSIADLARIESVRPQSMGATLAALERKKLVQRRPHPTDGRQILFDITELGVETLQHRRLLKREWLTRAVKSLSPEEQHNLAAATALIKRLCDS